MKIDLNLKTNRMIIDFKDDEELDDFIKFMEEAGYKARKSQAYN